MEELEQYIELIKSSLSMEDAFGHFTQIMAKYGYDKVTYSLVTDHYSIELPKKHGFATSYPDDWMKHYVQNDYFDDDPVVLKTLSYNAPFYWSELERDPSVSASSTEIMQQASEAGLRDGMAVPLFGAPGERVGLGIARSESVQGDVESYRFMAATQLLGSFLHQKFRESKVNSKVNTVSPREKDVLLWASEGKTNYEIGVILGISENTVKTHWKSIYSKLQAHGQVYAVTRAIATGIIVPQFIQAQSPDQVIADQS